MTKFILIHISLLYYLGSTVRNRKTLSYCDIDQDMGFSGALVVKNSPANAVDVVSIPGSGRSPGERNGNPLQYSCLENPMGRVAWRLQFIGLQRVGHNLASKHADQDIKLFLPQLTKFRGRCPRPIWQLHDHQDSGFNCVTTLLLCACCVASASVMSNSTFCNSMD